MKNVVEEKAQKYISKTERVLRDLKVVEKPVSIGKKVVKEVIEEAERYLEDAKYYLRRKEYEVSLASIAYCEGLLDALRMLSLVNFEW